MTPLWTSTDIASVTKGTTTGHFNVHGLSINTRSLQEGDLFFALKGDKLDGHDYVMEAIAKKAVAVVVDHHCPQIPDDKQVIVPNTLSALNDLAAAARKRFQGTVIALTGSLGKTSTKETLRQMLNCFGETYANAGNFNNIYGLPLSLASLPQNAAYGIFELGMNHPEEIRPLSRLTQPHLALITNVHAMHIGHFESVEGIARAKAEIFDGLLSEGPVVLFRDSPHFPFLLSHVPHHPLITFGHHPESILHMIQSPQNTLTLHVGTQDMTFKIGAPGDHWKEIAAAALSVIYALGLDLQKAGAVLKHMSALKGRGQQVNLPGEITVIDESYNAGPGSMRAALQILKTFNKRRKVFVMGDMAELGEDRRAVHESLASDISDATVDLFFGVGPLSKALGEKLPPKIRGGFAETTSEIIPVVLKALLPGDAVLVKGSRGKKLEAVIVSLEEMCNNKYMTDR